MRLILASASPRRAEILRCAGIPFEAIAAALDETPRAGESPAALVQRLAEQKAQLAARSVSGSAWILAADTEVALDGRIFGKPVSLHDAGSMLRALRRRTHDVVTGIAVMRVPQGELRVACEETRVTFTDMTEHEIARYVASGEPMDKAGAYAIQGRAGKFISRIEGCYFNVMGLPLARVYRTLSEMGWEETLGMP